MKFPTSHTNSLIEADDCFSLLLLSPYSETIQACMKSLSSAERREPSTKICETQRIQDCKKWKSLEKNFLDEGFCLVFLNVCTMQLALPEMPTRTQASEAKVRLEYLKRHLLCSGKESQSELIPQSLVLPFPLHLLT